MTATSSTVRKALEMMDGLLEKPEGMTLSQFAAATGLNKATALRLCSTLEAAGFLERDGSMVYRVGRKVWQLAQAYRQQFRLEEIVRPFLQSLRDQTGESASFYIIDGSERICLIRENSHQTIRHHLEEGTRLPLSQGVVGRVLLAFSGGQGAEFDQIRADGVLAAQGREPDTNSVAAPVFDPAGSLIGGLVVSGPQSRFSGPRQEAAVALVLEACDALRKRLPSQINRGEASSRSGERPLTPRRAARQKLAS